MAKECSCPSCGAPVLFRSPASILAVCSYCSSTIVRQDVNLELVGKMAELMSDGSPIQLGTTGRYREAPFTVVGRIQLRYPQGFWNEWHMLLGDERSGWLGESMGNYGVSFITPVPEKVPAFQDLKAGQQVLLKGAVYEVTDLENASCIGGEGELPFQIGPGFSAPAADLSGPGNAFASIDYSEEPPLVYLGEYVDFKELHLSGLRQLNGW